MTYPTYGYSPSGEARVFELDEGEGLPDGWFDSPAAATALADTDRAKAEAAEAAKPAKKA